MKTTFSPYKIYWIEFRAQNGIVTKKDERTLQNYTSAGRNRKSLLMHFGSKDSADAYIADNTELLNNKLSKSYEVRFFTDKQMSMSSVDYDNNCFVIPFTKKQNQEMFVIGKK